MKDVRRKKKSLKYIILISKATKIIDMSILNQMTLN